MMRLSIAALAVLAAPLGAQAPSDEVVTLARAIELAQVQGLSGRSAMSTLEAARWRQQEFRARFLPQISVSGELPSLFRQIDPVTQPDGSVRFVARSQMQSSLTLNVAQAVPLTGGELYLSSGLTRVDLNGENDTHFWQSTPLIVGMRQPLFQLNAHAWDRREQALSAEVAERTYLEAREDVAVTTVGAFFDAYRAKMTVDNLEANIAVNDTLFRLNQGRYQVGKIGENDLLQSELALLRARAAVEDARLNYDRALAELRLQLGFPPGTPLTIVPPTTIPDVDADTAAAVAAVLRNSSGAIGRDLQTLRAERGVREAKLSSGFGANLTAEAGYNQTGQSFGDVYKSFLGQQRFAVGVEMPLVQWGAGKARVEAARAEEERVESSIRLERERAMQEAHFAALAVDQSRRQVAIAAKADTVAAKRFEVAMNRYRIGTIGVDNLFTAQNEKDGALQAYMQALGAYWTAYYRLRRITLFDFAAGREIDGGESYGGWGDGQDG